MNVQVVCGLLLLSVCDVAARTIMEALASRYDIMSFSSLVRRAGMENLLNTGKYTVFAPVDAAFQALPQQMISQLYRMENLSQLKALVKYHIVPYTGNTHRHWTGEKVNTLASKPVRMVTYPHNKVTVVNGVVLTESNLSVSNGHIYLLSTTLAAPSGDIVKSLQQDSKYSMFLTAAALSGMTNKLKEDNITVLAPLDDAFLKMNKTRTDALFNNIPLLRALVEFHILPGVYYTGGLYDNDKLFDDNSKYDNTYTIHQFALVEFHILPGVYYSYGWYNKENIHDNNPKYDITYTVHEYGNHLFWITPFDGSVWNQDWLATNGVIHSISGVKYTWPFMGDLNRIIG